eukprot:746642-Hanusia_phi.AAC.1
MGEFKFRRNRTSPAYQSCLVQVSPSSPPPVQFQLGAGTAVTVPPFRSSVTEPGTPQCSDSGNR